MDDIKFYCDNCGLPSFVPGVIFDDKGICQFCSEYFKNKNKKELADAIDEKTARKIILDRIIEHREEKKTSKQIFSYDAVLMCSGGKDSSYLLYYLKKKLGLNILAFFFKHPLVPELAISNVRKITKTLNIDLISHEIDEKTYQNVMSYALLNPGIFGNECMRAGCAACSFLFWLFARKTAIDNDIPIIISGAQKNQVGASKKTILNSQHEWKGRIGSFQKSLTPLIKILNKTNKIKIDYKYNINKKIDIFFPLVFEFTTEEERVNVLTKNKIFCKEELLVEETNCSAFVFFMNWSFKKYNCLNEVWAMSKAIREGGCNNYDVNNTVKTKEDLINFLRDNKDFILFIEKNTKNSLTNSEECNKKIKKYYLNSHYNLSFDAYKKRIINMKINFEHYKKFFNIKL